MKRGSTKVSSPLDDFPKSELWRLFIDGHRQNEGPLAFDVAEKGYLFGALQAFEYLIKHLAYPVSPQLLLNLHNIAVKPVLDKSPNFYLPKELNFRDRASTTIGMVLNTTVDEELSADQQKKLQQKANISIAGLREILELMKTPEGKFIYLQLRHELLDVTIPFEQLVENIHTGYCSIVLAKDTVNSIYQRINVSAKIYYDRIIGAKDDDEKLVAIVMFVKDLELNHYFTDANCRTNGVSHDE